MTVGPPANWTVRAPEQESRHTDERRHPWAVETAPAIDAPLDRPARTHRADTVYLGVGALGKQSEEFRDEHWHHLVTLTGAPRVVPIHWDDFATTVDFPSRRSRVDQVELVFPVLERRTDPFHP